jgi:hypothetical protein
LLQRFVDGLFVLPVPERIPLVGLVSMGSGLADLPVRRGTLVTVQLLAPVVR